MARIFSSAPQTIWPAWYIVSSSCGDLQMTISSFRALENLAERTAHVFHTFRAVHCFEDTALPVIIRQRLRFAVVRCEPLFHDLGGVIRALYQLAAVAIAN